MTFEETIGIRLDDNGKLDIPQHIKRIKFDVGLSWCAPNSAAWLTRNEDNDMFVIGIEANKYACEKLGNRVWNPHPPNEECIITSDNYMLLNCAIDDVNNLEKHVFYHIDKDEGTSSLLKPTKKLKTKHNLDIKEVTEVNVLPLSYILDLIPWDRFNYIEHLKTDCQGKDLGVVLSSGKYLKKIVYLDVEIYTNGLYEDELDVNFILDTIKSKNFKLISGGINSSFVNKSLEQLIKPNKLDNYTTKF